MILVELSGPRPFLLISFPGSFQEGGGECNDVCVLLGLEHHRPSILQA